MSLKLRHHLYYLFCVTARFQLSPAPTSVKEVQFIHNAFKRIGAVEFFQVEQSRNPLSNPFRQHVTVVFNAANQVSQLNPCNDIDQTLKETAGDLQQRQFEIYKYLSSICGLPRYSYIEHDDRYFERRLFVPFKHTLAPDGRYLKDQYTISDSTIDSPFFTLSSDHDLKLVGSKLRHNFQKFHKIKPTKLNCSLLRYHKGLDGLYKEKMNLQVKPDFVVDTAALLNLEEACNIPEPTPSRKEFKGFLN